jgi:D-sedoheptulose 7-phosphate isomerase
MTDHTSTYLQEASTISVSVDVRQVDALVEALVELRARNGRLFLLGVGGSAANAYHAVKDFRKLCSIEAYAPTDNVAELSARINDEGWDSAFATWLSASNLASKDAVFVLSVGGGDEARGVSVNLIRAVELARASGETILGIVGRPDGFVADYADAAVVIPIVNPERLTPHSESFQSVIWHCLVSNPRLQTTPTTW